MESMAGVTHNRQHFLHLNPRHHRPPFPKAVSTISFDLPSKTTTIKTSLIRVSSSSSFLFHQTPQNPNKKPPPPQPFETLTPLFSFLKTTCLTIAATALFFNRFNKPSIAALISQPTFQESHKHFSTTITTTTTTDTTTDEEEEKERIQEEYVDSHPDDVIALKSALRVKMKGGNLEESISLVDRLIEMEPTVHDWLHLKAHLFSHCEDVELAKLGFEEVISKDPLLVEAYHGLVMATSHSESGELEDVLKRIENVIEMCKKEKNKEVLRDFKFLVALVRVIEGKYTDALKDYQELVKEEPSDFRPYLYQGFIYTMLKKQDEANKQFDMYRRLVPKGDPHARCFEDNMIATKVFSQEVDNQKMAKKM